jgi:hypothetical protein
MNTTRFAFVLFCAITLFSPCSATLEFRLISWAGTIEDLKYANGQKSVDVVAWDSVLSPKYQFTGAGPLVLFREIQLEDKTVREPVASLTPPAGFTHAILLLAPTDATKKTYTARWINDSPEVRQAQTITYENLSSYPVAIKLGEEKLTIAPQETLSRPTNPAFRRLALQIAAQTEKGWELVVSQSQPIRPGLRTLVLLRDGRPGPDGIKERLDYLTFSDLPPPPSPRNGPSLASR